MNHNCTISTFSRSLTAIKVKIAGYFFLKGNQGDFAECIQYILRYKQNKSGVLLAKSTRREETGIDGSTIIAFRAFLLFYLDWGPRHGHQTYLFIS
jgi:hypothetical protein